jgi:DNA-binding NtrC family response regulator
MENSIVGIAANHEKAYKGYSRSVNQAGVFNRVSDHFTFDAARPCMSMGRVFVVDDEEHVRKTVGLVLKQGGYEVLEAADGEEAIAVIQSYPTGFSVQAIICDIQLPKVSGNDLISFIRAKLPLIPVIVLTGHPNVHGAAFLFKQGVVDYLIKPAQPQTLLEAVGRAIGEQAVFE